MLNRGLGIGRNAPVTPSAATDAAVMLQSPMCSNAPRSVATSTPAFARLYEQAGHGMLKSLTAQPPTGYYTEPRLLNL